MKYESDTPEPHRHPPDATPRPVPADAAVERAAGFFRAMGDAARLRILILLLPGECCVSELVERLGEKFPTVSQRLRVLRAEGLITRRRAAQHLFYSLSDDHVRGLVENAVEHAQHFTPNPDKDSE